MTIQFHKIWIEQCDAARWMVVQFGPEKALKYLVGEKLVNFVRAAESSSDYAQQLPSFVAEIKLIFRSGELRDYLEVIRPAGSFGRGHAVQQFQTLAAHALDEAYDTEDELIVERITEMLLG